VEKESALKEIAYVKLITLENSAKNVLAHLTAMEKELVTTARVYAIKVGKALIAQQDT